MDEDENKLDLYIQNMRKEIGDYNTNLIEKYLNKYRSLPSAPGIKRVLLVTRRLKMVSIMMNNPKMDELTEDDLIVLNTSMRKKNMLSAQDYRKILKHCLRTLDKKKYYDIIESDFLKAPQRKANERLLVDPDTFWDNDEITRYLIESKKYSKRQAAWAGLWLSSGCRPHELFNLRKEDMEFDNNYLTIRVRQGKTGKRPIVLEGKYGKGAWLYIKPYLETLSTNQLLFDVSWTYQSKVHKKLCKRANIGSTKKINFYIARKMVLTRFYNDYKLVKAATLAGHVPGSKVMKHYVAMNETQLKEEAGNPVLSTKTCPNPQCLQENEPHENFCICCSSPLDKDKFKNLFGKQVEEIINTKLGLLKTGIENQLLNNKII